MILTYKQMKYLERDGDEQFKFVDNGKATDEEKQMLLDLDADYFDIYGTHIITNINALKRAD